MASFVCYGCRENKRIIKALQDSPVAKGYCTTESIGQNPKPGGCLYPQYLSAEKREKRVKWERT